MIDKNKRTEERVRKEKVRKRYATRIAPDILYPAKKKVDFYDEEVKQRVAIYVRVSTDHVEQVTSYELQKNYYESFVAKHPNWTLVRIYADEGLSGTSTARRKDLLQMLSDCRAGKIDIIITKSVSRFARNVVDCITMVRNLAELSHPVGVFFESECIFSLNQESQMPLSFLATIAQEESHIRSRSMEVSLSQRLNGGLPLTPKLLGYSHDADGQLVVNPDEAPTVKLMFYMYLYGYSSAQIAEALEALGRKTYLGNIKWTANSVIQVLRNERHCGDVLTRKTWTPDYLTHKSIKNRGERVQGLYQDHHEAIVSRDDFIAVQHLINNAKYGNKSILPELRVIDSGLLKGFVTISPKWAGFKAADYYQASMSVYSEEEIQQETHPQAKTTIEVEAGDFDMRGFEVTRAALFDTIQKPYAIFETKKLKFSMECVRRFDKNNSVELLIHPRDRLFAVRSVPKENRYGVKWSKLNDGKYYPKDVPCAAFGNTIFELFQWLPEHKYRVSGTLLESEGQAIYLFDLSEPDVFIKQYMAVGSDSGEAKITPASPLTVSGKRVRAIPKEWADSFGNQYYLHQLSSSTVYSQDEEEWKLRMEGQLFDTGRKLNVTSFEELKQFIHQELQTGVDAAAIAGEQSNIS